MRAYNDSLGITRDFNLNLLHRMNRELEGDIKIDDFKHYATYNVYSGAMENYLISPERSGYHSGCIKSRISFASL